MNFRVLFFLAFIMLVVSSAYGELPFAVPSHPGQLAQTALLETDHGKIEIEFFRETAPITVRGMQYLILKGYYDGLEFHDVVEGVGILVGDPKKNGTGGPPWTLPPEVNGPEFHRGVIGMARKRDPVNPGRRSHGSIFFITRKNAPHLRGFYTPIGRVIEGMDIVDQLQVGDKIKSMSLSKEYVERIMKANRERKRRKGNGTSTSTGRKSESGSGKRAASQG